MSNLQNAQRINRDVLGYSSGWFVYIGNLNRPRIHDGKLVDKDGTVFHCHPWIVATQMHVDALGVELGESVCAIRWMTL